MNNRGPGKAEQGTSELGSDWLELLSGRGHPPLTLEVIRRADDL